MSATIESFLKQHAPLASEGKLAVGRIIGPWQISAFLTRGGSGELYQAWDNENRRVAALKFVTEEYAPRLRHEASCLTSFSHPSFPTIYGIWELEEGVVLAEELLEPYPLPKSDKTVAQFITALCEGLEFLHTQGWVHRDLKPGNILSRPGETKPVMIDLGLAKRRSGQDIVYKPSTLSLRSDGVMLGHGTPGYAAPEQFSGDSVTLATDIHAVGVLINTCFADRLPYTWKRIVRRATSAVPHLRYPDTKALCRAIRWRHLPLALIFAFSTLLLPLLILFLLHPADEDPYTTSRKAMQENFEYFREVLDSPSSSLSRKIRNISETRLSAERKRPRFRTLFCHPHFK